MDEFSILNIRAGDVVEYTIENDEIAIGHVIYTNSNGVRVNNSEKIVNYSDIIRAEKINKGPTSRLFYRHDFKIGDTVTYQLDDDIRTSVVTSVLPRCIFVEKEARGIPFSDVEIVSSISTKYTNLFKQDCSENINDFLI